jgi:hypothetical protein
VFDAYIGTTGGVFRLRDEALEPLGLESERVSAIHAWREDDALALLAGSYGNGLVRSADGGRSWSRVQSGTWVCEPVDGDEDLHHITGDPNDPRCSTQRWARHS